MRRHAEPHVPLSQQELMKLSFVCAACLFHGQKSPLFSLTGSEDERRKHIRKHHPGDDYYRAIVERHFFILVDEDGRAIESRGHSMLGSLLSSDQLSEPGRSLLQECLATPQTATRIAPETLAAGMRELTRILFPSS